MNMAPFLSKFNAKKSFHVGLFFRFSLIQEKAGSYFYTKELKSPRDDGNTKTSISDENDYIKINNLLIKYN